MVKDRTETHQRENNPESEQHLQENQKKFSRQCLKVLQLLYQGKRLTTIIAPSYGILSLPRRIKDLKDNGVHIDEKWLTDENGKRTIKEWFMNFKTANKKDVIKKWGMEMKRHGLTWIEQELPLPDTDDKNTQNP